MKVSEFMKKYIPETIVTLVAVAIIGILGFYFVLLLEIQAAVSGQAAKLEAHLQTPHLTREDLHNEFAKFEDRIEGRFARFEDRVDARLERVESRLDRLLENRE